MKGFIIDTPKLPIKLVTENIIGNTTSIIFDKNNSLDFAYENTFSITPKISEHAIKTPIKYIVYLSSSKYFSTVNLSITLFIILCYLII